VTLTRRFWSLDRVRALVPGRVRTPRLRTAEPEPGSEPGGGTTRRWFIGALGLVVTKPEILIPREEPVFTLPPDAWLWGIPYHHNPTPTATWLGLDRAKWSEDMGTFVE